MNNRIKGYVENKIKIQFKDQKLMEQWIEKYGNRSGFGVPYFLSYEESTAYNEIISEMGDLLPDGKNIALLENGAMSAFIVYCYSGADKGKVYHVFHDDVSQVGPIPLSLFYKYCEKAFKLADSFKEEKGYTLKDDALEEGKYYFDSVADIYEFFIWRNTGYKERAGENFVMPIPENRLKERSDLVETVQINPDVEKRIKAVDWFAHCGEQNINCPFKVKYAKSIEEACKFSSGLKWSNLLLECQNELSAGLTDEASDYWNPFVHEIKKSLISEVEKVIENKLAEMNIESTSDVAKEIKMNVIYILLEFLLEDHFRPVNDQVFCEHLFCILEQGHIPCGWEGRFPLGKLIVF